MPGLIAISENLNKSLLESNMRGNPLLISIVTI